MSCHPGPADGPPKSREVNLLDPFAFLPRLVFNNMRIGVDLAIPPRGFCGDQGPGAFRPAVSSIVGREGLDDHSTRSDGVLSFCFTLCR